MKQQAIRNSSVVFFLGVIAAVVGYATRIFLARSLSVEDFGLFYSVLAAVGAINIFKDLGINTALVRFVPEFIIRKEKGNVRKAFYSSVLVQFVIVGSIAAIFLVFVSLLADYALLFNILIFSILFSVVFVAAQSTLQGMQKMREYSLVEPFRTLSTFGLMAALIGMGVIGAAIGYTVAAALTSVVFFFILTKRFPDILSKDRLSSKMTKQLLGFGLVFLAGAFATYFIQYTDTLVLSITRTFTEVGYYQAAVSTSQMLWIFVIPMASVLFPLVSALWASKKLTELEKTVRTFSTLAFFAMLPLSIIVFSFPEIVLNIFFGSNFLQAAHALRILSAGAVFFSLFFIFQTTLLGIGKPRINTKIIVLVSLFNLAANIFIIPRFGIEGAAVVSAFSYFIGTVVTYKYVRRFIGIKFPVTKMLKIFLAAIVTVIFIYVVKAPIHPHAYIEAFVVLVPAFLIYTAAIVLTKGVERSDLDELRNNGVPVPKLFYRVVR